MQALLKLVIALAAMLLVVEPASGVSYPVRGSFFNFYRNMSQELWGRELDRMVLLEMDTIVISSVGRLRPGASGPVCQLDTAGMLYPSLYAQSQNPPIEDRLGMILQLAQQRGMSVYIGSLITAGDWTTGMEFSMLRTCNKSVAAEILLRYPGQAATVKGWYFTQELWLNWAKYYILNNGFYYGTDVLRDFVTDMKSVNPAKLVSFAPVFKKTIPGGNPVMLDLTPQEAKVQLREMLTISQADLAMPQDGIGVGTVTGSPNITEVGAYYQEMRQGADEAGKTLWCTVETFTAIAGLSNDKYPPAGMARVSSQLGAIGPHVLGFVEWIFGNDMSPEATYYPVEASALYRDYSWYQIEAPSLNRSPITSMVLSRSPEPEYPDAVPSKLTNQAGGGFYPTQEHWVGFRMDTNPTLTITLDLGQVRNLRYVRVLSQSQNSGAIRHPVSMSVEVSPNGNIYTPYGVAFTNYPGNTPDFSIFWGEVVESKNARYVRVTLSSGPGWLLLSEVEVIHHQNTSPF